MRNQQAFTLLELLIVLSIWGLIILLSAPILFNSLDKQKEKRFLETLQYDILYIQFLSTTSTNENINIRFSNDHYSIRDGTLNSSLKRSFPTSWQVDIREVKYIAFTKNGTIKYAGTMQIETENSTYSIVFPPGKGRGYIVEQ